MEWLALQKMAAAFVNTLAIVFFFPMFEHGML